jgi:dienelactone hydrolase
VNTARIEIHLLDTLTLTDRQFLTGAKEAKPARIGTELRLPQGAGRFPVVVLVHGSAGVGAGEVQWSQELNKIGVATFLMDCFTGRGIVQTITDQSQLGHLAMIVDAYRALELLSKHAQIDASRIAVMGFSKGGFVALYSSMRRFQRLYGSVNTEFAAYIPFYARCDTPYIDDEDVSDKPIRLFHGVSDDYVPIDGCRRYVQRLLRAGKDVVLTEYPGARHAFDNPLYQPVRFMPDAQLPNRCRREERPGGVIINLDTGQPFSSMDACVTRGASLGYDPDSHADSIKAVTGFLKAALMPSNCLF